MNFALRDDDLNFFFSPEEIQKNYNDIWEICPVSMSVIPFVKGNWIKSTMEAEKRGPGRMSQREMELLQADNLIFPIGENSQLVNFIKEKIYEQKIYLTIHAIHHRNEDNDIPQLNNNFGFGAEFYTNRDLSKQLHEAIKYLEQLFSQKIEVFTPPQNLYSRIGLEAVLNNDLAICGDLPSIKKISTIKLFGLRNYMNYVKFKVSNRDTQYPYPIINDRFKIISHYRLQPGTDINALYNNLDRIREINGNLILSTHSYGFNYKMQNSEKTMGETLREFINFVSSKNNIQFLSLNKIFENS